MNKKIVGVFLTLTLFCTFFACLGMTAAAEDIEHVANGGFEDFTADKIASWGAVGGSVGTQVTTGASTAHDGKSGVGLISNGSPLYVSQNIKTLQPNTKYTLSAWLKVVSVQGNGAEIKIEFNGGKTSASRSYSQSTANNTWKQITFDFTTPADLNTCTILVRNTKSVGELYWDTVSIMGPGATTEPPTPDTPDGGDDVYNEVLPMAPGASELLKDGGFETLNAQGTGLTRWSSSLGWNKEVESSGIVTVSDIAHSGKHSVRILAKSGSPLIAQRISNLEVGATYQASIWVKVDSTRAKPGFKIEWYKADSTMINGVWVGERANVAKTDGWMQIGYHFTVPEGCEYISYMVRSYTDGSTFDVYFDDASCYKIKDAVKTPVKLNTDNIFYYSEDTEGIATITPDFKNFPTLASVEMKLKDKSDKVVETGTIAPTTGAIWRFNLGLMAEKAEYAVEAVGKDAAGTVLGSTSIIINKYPRPTTMMEDGTLIGPDGKPFYPTFVYHMYEGDLKYAQSIGVNLSQAQGGTTLSVLKDYVDEAWKYGVRSLVPLYRDMKPAGHPDNVKNTTEVINGLKDHPGVVAWMVMDEATSHWPDRWDLFYDSYKLIRELDPTRPVYILQNNPEQFAQLGKYADILAYDPYPMMTVNLAKHVANYTTTGVDGLHYKKPIWSLNKAYGRMVDWDAAQPNDRGLPTAMEEKNMWYQGLFAGASAMGYYSYSDCICLPERLPMHNTSEPKLVAFYEGLKEFAKAEMAESYEVFLDHKYPTFAENRDLKSDAWYRGYIKDGKLRYVILNRYEEQKTVSIPLTSDGGAVSVGAFSATRVYGDTHTTSGNGTLTITLEPSAAYVYEITPNEAVNFSQILPSKFHDIGTHPFAAAHIRHLENAYGVEGTAPSAFSPGANITEGDAADMLSKALGYTMTVASPYGEVQKTDFYANLRAALLAAGKSEAAADVILAKVQTAVQAQITAGNVSASTPLTRAEAAFILSEAMMAKEADEAVGIYQNGMPAKTLAAGNYSILFSEKAEVKRAVVALYRTNSEKRELVSFLETTSTAEGWNFTVPTSTNVSEYEVRVFLWNAKMQPQSLVFTLR